MAAVGVVVFVVALLLSIALHELGHLVTAKKFGMKASRYFIGMGPTLWSTWRGETEYGVKALPIGGFVKIVGMTQIEELDDPKDEPRAFWRQPAPQRAVVLAAGSFMHFVIAFVLIWATVLAYGEFTDKGTTRVAYVSDCLKPDPETKKCDGKPLAPAKAAGVREGDRVVEFEGRPVTDWDALTKQIQEHPAGPAELVVLRDGQRVPITVSVERNVREIEKGVTREAGQVGLSPGETKRYNPVTAIGRTGTWMWDLTTGSVAALVEIPSKIPELLRDTAESEQRQADDGGPVSVVDIGRLSGQAFEARQFAAVLFMIASLNVFVGLFNLLPLLPLDGGHLAILAFESVRSRIARALGRRDPGRVDITRLMPLMVGFIVLMGSLTVVLVYAGITNPMANPFAP